jgi:hypothetical protein
MLISRIAAALLSLLIAASAAVAADQTASGPQPASHPAPRPPSHVPRHHGTCLSKAEQRAEVAAHRAISLGQAIHTLRAHGKRRTGQKTDQQGGKYDAGSRHGRGF